MGPIFQINPNVTVINTVAQRGQGVVTLHPQGSVATEIPDFVRNDDAFLCSYPPPNDSVFAS